ncbi:hypothetical protein [Oceanospirillum linum]|uniref:hypothetical protein n=1 Tax=Oceanospirillum linum TaxID=966 RepID=UPI00089F7A48|nr:hypothetical protein [Oceanospirillum linum]SEG02277.1 hypothetical protein SAMN04489856_104132 [Oleiphilus messinensis]SMP21617.1 hypothetical protein SAMN06264348_104126 [Oceanospirillum linum]
MPHSTTSKRLQKTSLLCDELALTMAEIQSRLENRRSRMRDNMERMAKGLKIQGRF